MRSSEQAARLLMQGLLEVASWPEFEDEAFFEDVRHRLGGVGYELGSVGGYWLARTREPEAVDGFRQLFPLNEAEYAVLAALYLYLRFLPRQSEYITGADKQASVALEDIERGFPAYTVETTRRILGRLRNLLFVRQYGERLYPGPYLAAIDELVADERAKEALRDFKLRSHLRTRLAALQEEFNAAD
jgi:hypothetical protein